MPGRDHHSPASGTREILELAAGTMTAGWNYLDRLYIPPQPYLASIVAALGLFLLARSLAEPIRLRSTARILALGVLSLLCLAGLDRILILFEVRVPQLAVYSQLVAPLVDRVGYDAASAGGALQIYHPDGLVTIAPSFEKMGVRPLVELWSLWVALLLVLDRRRLADVAGLGALALSLVALARFAVCVLVYLEADHILSPPAGYYALSIFTEPSVDAVTLILAGLTLGMVRRMLTRGTVPELAVRLPIRSTVRLFSYFLGFGLLIGFTSTFVPPGREKSGRVLIDDRFCGVWEPTARLLDTEWYGDFATYSFSSLAEWLGHRFVVDVNTKRTYTDELLSGYDVLILKTPVRPIADVEREAIDRFVTSGGGLLLVGDHTNLLGMGTHLNSLCGKYGLRFRYDSVSDATTGGFVDYYAPSIGRSVGAIHVEHLQFMTSCSLELGPWADAIVTATSCRRDPHDYANSSFFGRVGPHPELAHGSAVLAATAPAGRGRIAAFTDSTVWSSFAVFQYDREKLAADLVSLLNREPSPLRALLRGVALVALFLGLLAATAWVRIGAALPVLLGGLIGIWGGVLGADRAHLVAYDLGPPHAPIHEVSFLWQGGGCAFPPVLGNIDPLPADRAFDTLLVAFQRLGLVPRVAYTYDRDLLDADTRVLIIIAPVNRPPRSTLARIESFVRGGGSLVIIDDGRLGGTGSAPDYLSEFGIDLRYTRDRGEQGDLVIHSSLAGAEDMTNRRAPDTFVGHRTHGGGHVVYMRDAPQFSRVGMGHCFARPGRIARSRYETIFFLVRDVLKINVGDRKFYGVLE